VKFGRSRASPPLMLSGVGNRARRRKIDDVNACARSLVASRPLSWEDSLIEAMRSRLRWLRLQASSSSL